MLCAFRAFTAGLQQAGVMQLAPAFGGVGEPQSQLALAGERGGGLLANCCFTSSPSQIYLLFYEGVSTLFRRCSGLKIHIDTSAKW